MENERTAKAIEEVFAACGSVSAFPVFNDGTELAPEVLSALECGMSAALVTASAIARGKVPDADPNAIAANMKVTAVRTYVESVVFAGAESDGEVEHGHDEE